MASSLTQDMETLGHRSARTAGSIQSVVIILTLLLLGQCEMGRSGVGPSSRNSRSLQLRHGRLFFCATSANQRCLYSWGHMAIRRTHTRAEHYEGESAPMSKQQANTISAKHLGFFLVMTAVSCQSTTSDAPETPIDPTKAALVEYGSACTTDAQCGTSYCDPQAKVCAKKPSPDVCDPSASNFAHCKEDRYKFPIAADGTGLSYANTKIALRNALSAYIYYSGTTPDGVRQRFPDGYLDYAALSPTDPRYFTYSAECYSGKGIDALDALTTGALNGITYPGRVPTPLEWSLVYRLARFYFDGYLVTRNDPELLVRPGNASDAKAFPGVPSTLTLNEALRKAVGKLGDHTIAFATQKTPVRSGAVVKPSTTDWTWLGDVDALGWNNLAAGWDAWANNTCGAVTEPNLFAQGWGMLTLILAAKLDPAGSRYLLALRKGSNYYHTSQAAGPLVGSEPHHNAIGDTPSLTSSVDTASAIVAPLQKYLPYEMKRLYTVGGSRWSGTASDPTQLAIRYHYTPVDPGYFTLNCESLLALAMVEAGDLLPSASHQISDGKGGLVSRTFANIGRWSLYPVMKNLEMGNAAYSDVDSVRYTNNVFEHHLPLTTETVASAGAMFGYTDYVNAVVNLVKDPTIDAAISTQLGFSKPAEKRSFDIYCVQRELDPVFMSRCIEIVNGSWTDNSVSPPVVYQNFNQTNYRHVGTAIRQIKE